MSDREMVQYRSAVRCSVCTHCVYLSVIGCLLLHGLLRAPDSPVSCVPEDPLERGADVLYRIDMLQEHLRGRDSPTREWVDSVLGAAKYELVNRRIHSAPER